VCVKSIGIYLVMASDVIQIDGGVLEGVCIIYYEVTIYPAAAQIARRAELFVRLSDK